MRFLTSVTMFAAALSFCAQVGWADQISEAIQKLQSVESGGKGSAAARESLRVLSASGAEAILPVLEGFRGSSPLAINWLRNAFEELVAEQRKAGVSLPASSLERFIQDRQQSPTARRLAYESLLKQDAGLEERLIPGMLLDPSSEFRRDAVARLIAEAGKTADAAAASKFYRKALSGAVHEDQVKQIAGELRKAGETVDIQKHFGFIPRWMIAGPFDNREEAGFAVAYTPEKDLEEGRGVDLSAEYDGQLGKVRWQSVATADDYGVVDIAKQIENYKGSLMYATTVWKSEADRQVQIRLGTPNAWKLWVNGKLVFEREEYHRSSQMDQYTVPVELKAGDNLLMVKVCQNEQTQDWAQRYQFQLRVCDSTGSAVLPVTTTAQRDTSDGGGR